MLLKQGEEEQAKFKNRKERLIILECAGQEGQN